MPAITLSEVVSDSPQIDGRRHIIERHIDARGREILVFYLAEQQADVLAFLLARVPSLEAQLKQSEIDQATNGNPVGMPVFNTGPEFLLGWREKYRDTRGQELVSMLVWMEAAIDAGLVTQAQLRDIFELTQGQWDALKAQWDDYKSKLKFVNSAAGS